jgi:hypothetical protein
MKLYYKVDGSSQLIFIQEVADETEGGNIGYNFNVGNTIYWPDDCEIILEDDGGVCKRLIDLPMGFDWMDTKEK